MIAFQTVVELHTFGKRAKAIMSDEERHDIVTFVATNPEAGISLGGGLRKLRVRAAGRAADIAFFTYSGATRCRYFC